MKVPYPTFSEEKKLWSGGYTYVVGLDEVGRGAFAGPVVAAAVIFPVDSEPISGVHDSKLVSKKKRKELATLIKKHALAYAVSEVSLPIINRYGIGRSCQIAFRKAIRQLKIRPNFFVIDAFYIERITKKKQKPITKGDQKSISIAAASIIAKVYRDELMEKLHSKFPAYNFVKNVGYGTREHRDAIKKFGLCQLHRTSFDLRKYRPD